MGSGGADSPLPPPYIFLFIFFYFKKMNQARKDGEWGSRSICHMIEIYLDPNQLGEELNTGPMIETDKVEMALN
jgi:hypothetical protein